VFALCGAFSRWRLAAPPEIHRLPDGWEYSARRRCLVTDAGVNMASHRWRSAPAARPLRAPGSRPPTRSLPTRSGSDAQRGVAVPPRVEVGSAGTAAAFHICGRGAIVTSDTAEVRHLPVHRPAALGQHSPRDADKPSAACFRALCLSADRGTHGGLRQRVRYDGGAQIARTRMTSAAAVSFRYLTRQVSGAVAEESVSIALRSLVNPPPLTTCSGARQVAVAVAVVPAAIVTLGPEE
jgi:hypothetical protein